MVNSNMKPRVVICDVYHTILAVHAPPPAAESRWLAFWESIPGMKRRMDMDEFSAAVRGIIDAEHATAKAAGVSHPEVFWPTVLSKAVPELAAVPEELRNQLLWQQAQFLHTVTLMDGAVGALKKMQSSEILLGLASNSQPYTLRELDTTFATAGLSRDMFETDLCFFSFEHGFSKPDRQVYQFLAGRLAARNIKVSEALMIGNRLDNDVLPAKLEGWQTWHFTEKRAGEPGEGTWEQFGAWLDSTV